MVVKRNYYILHYFYVPTASWMGGRCYEPTIEGLSKAVDDYIKLASGTPAVPSSHIGAVTIHEPGGALLWSDCWTNIPFAKAVYHIREARAAIAEIGDVS